MQKNNSQFTFKSYLDLAQLLKEYKGNHKENRTFALTQQKKGLKLLITWKDKNLYRVLDEFDSSKYLHYLTLFTSLFGFILLIAGFITGFALLSYSGKEPVNVIYLLLVMVGLPLLSMGLSILSLLTGNLGATLLNHLSPLYYLEKVINFFPFAKKIDFSTLPFSTTLSKWIFLQRLQLFSFLFALGLFFSLVLTVISKDIAFAWSSTLEIDPIAFQGTLAMLAMPWQGFFPSAVPSVELVEVSHYFRLGEKLDVNMVQNADKLGAWWKFLAMATLTYAVFLRLIFWCFTSLGLKAQLKKEFLTLSGVQELLSEFSTPYVSTQAQNVEHHLDISEEEIATTNSTFAMKYHTLLGWNHTSENLLLIEDHFRVKAIEVYVVGGRNSFKEDQKIIANLEKSVLLYVKAWEPPTMDFMDFLDELLNKEELLSVDICPLGTASNNYASESRDLHVWLKKLEQVNSNKLGVIDV
ncbi:MAG: Unknown protein [uncultured Sulfurovum sp.]|uniref:DUF2868 domain-containing protein n=1 Tax=uncultured Sulfurovum sp. TaxID=269237 RepID=A0A6S6SXH3_9BACT|nr:MAG: Unknown protein [uncultured Sulfurovum sp.]